MTTTPAAQQEGLHILVLKAAVYAGTALLFAVPLTGWAGIASALAMIPVALLLSRWLAATRLRWPVLAGAGLGTAILGLNIYGLLGSQGWFAQWLGYQEALAALEGLMFGLITLGTLFGLRSLTLRLPALALVEAALVAAVVVWSFVGHRDGNMSRPQQLSDWAFSRGYDPLMVILGVGLVTLAGLALLLLRGQKLVKTVGTLLFLGLICVGVGLWLQTVPAAQQPIQDEHKDKQSDKQNRGPKPPPRLVAVVLLKDDYEPAEKLFYFRQEILSQFNGKCLVPANRPETEPTSAEPTATPILRPLYKRKPVKTQVVELIEQPKPLLLVNGTSMAPLDNPNPKMFSRAYEVASLVQDSPYFTLTYARLGNPGWSPEERKEYLAFPDDPRYRKLADEIVQSMRPQDRNMPFLQVLQTKRWLEKNVIYSKKLADPGEEDTTTAFLFGDRRGKCLHFAHALAYLLRAQGIPARIGGGFAVDLTSRRGSNVGVWDFMGHAWCEIYVDGLGWIVMDVAAERTEEEADQIPDPMLITQLGEMARHPKPPTTAKELEDFEAADAGVPVLVLGFGTLMCLYLVKLWRQVAPRVVRTKNLHRAAYRAVLDKLAEVGLVRQFGETREEFAQRLAHLAPSFVDLSKAHVRQALGGIAPAGRPMWRSLGMGIQADLAGKFSLFRRVLGTLNPIAWCWAR